MDEIVETQERLDKLRKEYEITRNLTKMWKAMFTLNT